MSQEIFNLFENGDEEGVRRVIAADSAVVHARDSGRVSYPQPNIVCRIYMLSSMSILISSHISIICSTITLLCTVLR